MGRDGERDMSFAPGTPPLFHLAIHLLLLLRSSWHPTEQWMGAGSMSCCREDRVERGVGLGYRF